MKRILILAGILTAVLGGGFAAWFVHYHSQRPEALIQHLLYGKGDPEELTMRINVARGEVVPHLIEAMKDPRAPASGRANILELLIKRNFRSSNEQIEQAILTALKDPDPVVRRKAAHGLAFYAKEELQVALADSLTDPDPEVRRQVYLVLGDFAHRNAAESGVWKCLSKQQKEQMLQDCRENIERETDPEMRILCRAVIGREIEIRRLNAKQALQTADITKAETILRSALDLDPENHQARTGLARFYFKTGEKEKMLEIARKHHALIEIPLLSKPPEIDGDPTDEVWGEAYSTETFYQTTSRWVPRVTEGRSKAYIAHHGGKIYIAVLGYEKDLTKLIQKHTGRDTDVWKDDCVEILFDPGNTEKDYYQFVINPAGGLFDQANREKSLNFKCQYNAKVFYDRGYWGCEFALDGKDLDNHPITPGTIWSMVLCRTRIGPASELGAIWPMFGWTQQAELYPFALFK
jgi:hypothetical protein